VAVSDLQLPSIPPGVLFPSVRIGDQLWPPPGIPAPDLYKRGMTEAREVIRFYYGDTSSDKLDALKHLANIATLKAGRRYWSPRPYLKFKDQHGRLMEDWENCDPNFPHLRRDATRGFFITALPAHLDRYSPRHVTKAELLALASIRDEELLHVCHTLVCDMQNEGEKHRRHDLGFSPLLADDGDYFCHEDNHEVTQPTAAPTFQPDYAGAVEMLVKDKALRAALPRHVCMTLEMVFRKLAAGVDATDIISSVADVIKRDERTVRRDLAKARRTANDVGSSSLQLMEVLASHVLPDRRVDAMAESAALKSPFVN
jgi:hypothetical protein